MKIMTNNNDIIADLEILSKYIGTLKTRSNTYHSQCKDDMELGSSYAFGICVKEIDKLLNKYKGE